MTKKTKELHSLEGLVSVGKATLKDFELLGITNLKTLAKQDAHTLYVRICRLTKAKHDPCVEDVFAAAIAQAAAKVKNTQLPDEKKQWHYWSEIRKLRPVRCAWVPVGNRLYEQYHDKEWGVPVYDDRIHFEFLILEGAQAGLSWETILKRRQEYRKAFANFNWKKVADFDKATINDLLKYSGIIRNRAKVESAVNNAKRFCEVVEEFGSFNAYIWGFVKNKPLQPKRKSFLEIPSESEESRAISRDLKKRGFTFVGPTVIYAHMQATGLINDHTVDCFCFKTVMKNHQDRK